MKKNHVIPFTPIAQGVIVAVIILLVSGYLWSTRENETITTGTSAEVATDFGFVRSAKLTASGYQLEIDSAVWLSDDGTAESRQKITDAMLEDGICELANECDIPNGYYIQNSSTIAIFLPVTDTAIIMLQTYSHDAAGGYNWNEVIPLPRFADLINGQHIPPEALEQLEGKTENYQNFWISTIPFRITIENGVVTSVVEQYVP